MHNIRKHSIKWTIHKLVYKHLKKKSISLPCNKNLQYRVNYVKKKHPRLFTRGWYIFSSYILRRIQEVLPLPFREPHENA